MTSTAARQVVWGLSILGYVPGNSLLESLGGILTDRLRKEYEDAAPAGVSTPPAVTTSTTASAIGAGHKGTPPVARVSEAGDKLGGAVYASGHFAEGTSSAGAGEGADTASATGEGRGSAGTARSVSEEGGAALVGGGARDGSVGADDGDRNSGGAAATTAAASKPVLVTSGTDLATAALSFAYAHVRWVRVVFCRLRALVAAAHGAR